MEYLNCLFKDGLELLRIVTIYKPPPKAMSPNVPVFLREFADLLEDLTLTSGQLLLVGDLNFHFDNAVHTQNRSSTFSPQQTTNNMLP
jgi:exonuclease III